MRKIFNKIRLLIKRGLITLDRTDQQGQTSYMGMTSTYEAIKPLGFESRPISSYNSLAILFSLCGADSMKVGFEYDNKRLFESEILNAGEVVVYNPYFQNSYIIFKNTGETKVVGTTIAIGNSTTELLQKISDTLDKLIVHVHSSPMGPTGAPNNAVDLTTIKTAIDALKGSIS